MLADTLTSLMGYVAASGNPLLRTRALQFLALKLRTLSADTLTSELQEFVCAEAKKVLPALSGDDFMTLLTILQRMPQYQTLQGACPSDPDVVDDISQVARSCSR